MIKRKWLSIFGALLVSTAATASSLPRGLNSEGQKDLLRIIGFGVTSKTLGNPYPLGGYEGVEVGLTLESISLLELHKLGTTPTEARRLNYGTLHFSKGLFYNVDLSIFFTPLQSFSAVQAYGGQLRYGFFEDPERRISATFVFHGSGANFDNLVYTRTTGAQVLGVYHFHQWMVYGGIGQSRTIGTFVSGGNGITDDPTSGDAQQEFYSDQYTVGLHVGLGKFFVATEWNRFFESNYSIKIGARY